MTKNIVHATPWIAIARQVVSAFFLCCLWSPQAHADTRGSPATDALIVVGAGGTDEYLDDFQRWADRWGVAFPQPVHSTVIGGRSQTSAEDSATITTDRQRILDWIGQPGDTADRERWLVLIGHGTYQLKIAKFNLEGPDLSADELAQAVATSPARWRIFICASCSGPFINALSGPNRIVVTATKSGSEQNLSRFGEYLSQSINAPSADLDHDGNVSILEAFIAASGELAKWYADEGRIASEQALLDDNGDLRGTPGNFFRGVRAAKAPADGLKVDGQIANRAYLIKPAETASLTVEQQAKVVELEQEVELLRQQKSEFAEAVYYAQLELLMVDLAHLLAPSPSNPTPPTTP